MVTRQLKQTYYPQCKWHSKYRKITLKTTGRRYHRTQMPLPSFGDTPFLAHIYGKAGTPSTSRKLVLEEGRRIMPEYSPFLRENRILEPDVLLKVCLSQETRQEAVIPH